MKVEYLPEKKLKTMIKQALSKHLLLADYRLFFFGSRVKGDHFPHSDIDIGIEGKRELPARIKLAIEEELENLPLLYKLELVDFKTVSPRFKREALKFTEKI